MYMYVYQALMFRAVIFIAGAGGSFLLRAARAHTRAHTPRPYPRTYSAHILLCTSGYVRPTVSMCRVCARCMCAQTRLCAPVCAQKSAPLPSVIAVCAADSRHVRSMCVGMCASLPAGP